MSSDVSPKRRPRWRVVALLLAAGLFAAVLVLPRLLFPPPATADVAGLRRWLLLRDLSSQPRSVQETFVDRLQYEIGPEQLLAGQASQNAAPWTLPLDQAFANGRQLQRVWFELRSAQYVEVPPEKRMEFLRAQIDALFAWSGMLAKPSAGGGSELSGVTEFFDNIQRWMAEAPPQQRRAMSRAVADGLLCWLATTDLQRLPLETRQQLAEYLLEQLTAPGASGRRNAPPADALVLSPAERATLGDSILSLAHAWIVRQSRRFAALAPAERDAFLAEQMRRVLRLDLTAYLGPGPAGESTAAGGQGLLSLLGQITALNEGLSATDQQHVSELLWNVQRKIIAETFGKIWSSEQPGAKEP